MQRTAGFSQVVIIGAIGGVIAGVVMALYAMLASATFLGQGLFTPLYGMGAPLIGESHMMESMQRGVHFNAGPALVGLVAHLIWSAGYGVAFALIAYAVHLTGIASLAAGVVFGIIVMLFMAFVVLPILGMGGMVGMLGWPSFTLEHAIFGFMLGLVPFLRPEVFESDGADAAVASRRQAV